MTLTAKRMMCLVLRAMLMLMLIIVYRSSSAALLGLSREDQWVSASSLLGFRWLSLSSLFHFLESRCNTKLTKSITLCFCFRLLVLLSTKLALIIWSPHSFPLWKWLPKYGPATSIINDGGLSSIMVANQSHHERNQCYDCLLQTFYIDAHQCNDIATTLIEHCCFCPSLTTRIIPRVL